MSAVFYFCLLLYFIMEKSVFDSLFGFGSTTATVVDEPPPAELDAFKIPMKIVDFPTLRGKVKALPPLEGCGRGGIRTPDTVVRSHVL